MSYLSGWWKEKSAWENEDTKELLYTVAGKKLDINFMKRILNFHT